MLKDIFVFVEIKEGAVRKAAMELLSVGKGVAEKVGSKLYAVLVGSNLDRASHEVREFADTVIVVDNPALKEYRNDTYVNTLEWLILKYDPAFVFGAATSTGKDLFPRLAARLGAAIVSDAVGLELTDGALRVKKPLYGGKILSWIAIKGEGKALITFRPNSFAVEQRGLDGNIVFEDVAVQEDLRITLVGVEKGGGKKVDLQEADFIICGGRGMKDAENFTLLEEIAGLMGGRVGASRAVVDSKWRDYDDQIGKSGKTVSPKLYIGCGVSGALHHIMGMDTSKVIVAVNRDPNAIIFQYADYGIVDDLFTILPALKEELKRSGKEI
jgi:electron transfer flavoprotein alpha subunit